MEIELQQKVEENEIMSIGYVEKLVFLSSSDSYVHDIMTYKRKLLSSKTLKGYFLDGYLHFCLGTEKCRSEVGISIMRGVLEKWKSVEKDFPTDYEVILDNCISDFVEFDKLMRIVKEVSSSEFIYSIMSKGSWKGDYAKRILRFHNHVFNISFARTFLKLLGTLLMNCNQPSFVSLYSTSLISLIFNLNEELEEYWCIDTQFYIDEIRILFDIFHYDNLLLCEKVLSKVNFCDLTFEDRRYFEDQDSFHELFVSYGGGYIFGGGSIWNWNSGRTEKLQRYFNFVSEGNSLSDVIKIYSREGEIMNKTPKTSHEILLNHTKLGENNKSKLYDNFSNPTKLPCFYTSVVDGSFERLIFVSEGDNIDQEKKVCLSFPENFYLDYVDLGDGFAMSTNPLFNSSVLVYFRGDVIFALSPSKVVKLGNGFLQIHEQERNDNVNVIVIYMGEKVIRDDGAMEIEAVPGGFLFEKKVGKLICWKSNLKHRLDQIKTVQIKTSDLKKTSSSDRDEDKPYHGVYSSNYGDPLYYRVEKINERESKVLFDFSSTKTWILLIEGLYEMKKFDVLQEFSQCLELFEKGVLFYDRISHNQVGFHEFCSSYQKHIVNLHYINNCQEDHKFSEFSLIPKDVLRHKIIPFLSQTEILFSIHREVLMMMEIALFSSREIMIFPRKSHFQEIRKSPENRDPWVLLTCFVIFQYFSTNEEVRKSVGLETEGMVKRFGDESMIFCFFREIFVENESDEYVFQKLRIELFKFLLCCMKEVERGESSQNGGKNQKKEKADLRNFFDYFKYILEIREEKKHIRSVFDDIASNLLQITCFDTVNCDNIIITDADRVELLKLEPFDRDEEKYLNNKIDVVNLLLRDKKSIYGILFGFGDVLSESIVKALDNIIFFLKRTMMKFKIGDFDNEEDEEEKRIRSTIISLNNIFVCLSEGRDNIHRIEMSRIHDVVSELIQVKTVTEDDNVTRPFFNLIFETLSIPFISSNNSGSFGSPDSFISYVTLLLNLMVDDERLLPFVAPFLDGIMYSSTAICSETSEVRIETEVEIINFCHLLACRIRDSEILRIKCFDSKALQSMENALELIDPILRSFHFMASTLKRNEWWSTSIPGSTSTKGMSRKKKIIQLVVKICEIVTILYECQSERKSERITTFIREEEVKEEVEGESDEEFVEKEEKKETRSIIIPEFRKEIWEKKFFNDYLRIKTVIGFVSCVVNDMDLFTTFDEVSVSVKSLALYSSNLLLKNVQLNNFFLSDSNLNSGIGVTDNEGEIITKKESLEKEIDSVVKQDSVQRLNEILPILHDNFNNQSKIEEILCEFEKEFVIGKKKAFRLALNDKEYVCFYNPLLLFCYLKEQQETQGSHCRSVFLEPDFAKRLVEGLLIAHVEEERVRNVVCDFLLFHKDCLKEYQKMVVCEETNTIGKSYRERLMEKIVCKKYHLLETKRLLKSVLVLHTHPSLLFNTELVNTLFRMTVSSRFDYWPIVYQFFERLPNKGDKSVCATSFLKRCLSLFLEGPKFFKSKVIGFVQNIVQHLHNNLTIIDFGLETRVELLKIEEEIAMTVIREVTVNAGVNCPCSETLILLNMICKSVPKERIEEHIGWNFIEVLIRKIGTMGSSTSLSLRNIFIQLMEFLFQLKSNVFIDPELKRLSAVFNSLLKSWWCKLKYENEYENNLEGKVVEHDNNNETEENDHPLSSFFLTVLKEIGKTPEKNLIQVCLRDPNFILLVWKEGSVLNPVEHWLLENKFINQEFVTGKVIGKKGKMREIENFGFQNLDSSNEGCLVLPSSSSQRRRRRGKKREIEVEEEDVNTENNRPPLSGGFGDYDFFKNEKFSIGDTSKEMNEGKEAKNSSEQSGFQFSESPVFSFDLMDDDDGKKDDGKDEGHVDMVEVKKDESGNDDVFFF